METQFLALAALCAALVPAAAFAFLLDRARAAEFRAEQAALRAQAQGRCLGMIARELEAPGLSLLGLAARLPPPAAAQVEAEGRRLLALSEEVADHLLAWPGLAWPGLAWPGPVPVASPRAGSPSAPSSTRPWKACRA